MSLKIAQVAPLWLAIPPRKSYGGIEVLLQSLCDELVRRGHDVTLFASGEARTRARLVPVIEKNLSDLMTEGRAQCYEYYCNSMFADIAAIKHRFDLIHFHCPTAWLPTAAMLDVRALFTVHTAVHQDDEWVLRRWPEVWVNGISQFQIKALAFNLGREFPVVYNGCDFTVYEPRYEPGRYLAFLGRFSREKNPLGAIQIARECRMPIVLAGQPQNKGEEAYFDCEIRPLIDGEGVRWIGAVDHAQKVTLLREASALVFPIQWDEPFGLVMIEAMACGTPVVALRRGAVVEIVDQGITGFHATSLRALSTLIPLAISLDRQQVRRQAVSRFCHRSMVTSYEALYRKIVASTSSPTLFATTEVSHQKTN